MSAFPWGALGRSLDDGERKAVRDTVRRLLRWQRDLTGWPGPRPVPDASPFVSLYEDGRLLGCHGSAEGTPPQRLARAFLRALSDPRFPSVRDRARVVASVSYVTTWRRVDRDRVPSILELGEEGVALSRAGRPKALLLPEVAFEGGASDAAALLAQLDRKAHSTEGTLHVFRTEEVVVRPSRRRPGGEPARLAARWLTDRLGKDGSIGYAIDARTRSALPVGPLHHARAAAALEALDRTGARAPGLTAARRRFAEEARAAMGGGEIPGWPTEPAREAATLALLTAAGVDVRPLAIEACASAEGPLSAQPWHAAQVVRALGTDAPASLYRACLDALEGDTLAPWTLLAARELGDMSTERRIARELAKRIRREPPFVGGLDTRPIPEVTLTGLVVEALAGAPGREARAAVKRGRAFLRRMQLGAEHDVPAALDEDMARGAFPLSPVVRTLRIDATAHCLSALAL